MRCEGRLDLGAGPLKRGGQLTEALNKIHDQQRSWAGRKNIAFDEDGYTLQLNDNLFQPLSEQSIRDFESGRGNELTSGKMQALHSSSALVCNVFEYWRRDCDGIALACGAERGISFRLEKQNPTGLRGGPPHLDVEFTGPGIPLAVESKFVEPYRHEGTSSFQPSYFKKPGLWDNFPRCEQLAKEISEGLNVFQRLDAAQLLKHVLGLKKAYQSGFKLLYIWYKVPSREAAVHEDEILVFCDRIGGEVDFRHMTYQDLFGMIKQIPDAGSEYISYLEERYFGISNFCN